MEENRFQIGVSFGSEDMKILLAPMQPKAVLKPP
jgi:hypothetical protein